MLLLLALPAFSFAATQQECASQLTNCVQLACVQAGCQLTGQGLDARCSCTTAEETQWDSLIASQCNPQYASCVQSGSGTSTSGSTSSGGCCGSGLVLLFGAAGVMLASKV